MLFGVDVALVEVIVVLGLKTIVFDRMLKDGLAAALSIAFVVSSIETLLLDVVDGHEYLSELRHLSQLL